MVGYTAGYTSGCVPWVYLRVYLRVCTTLWEKGRHIQGCEPLFGEREACCAERYPFFGRKGGMLRRESSPSLGEREACCAESSLFSLGCVGGMRRIVLPVLLVCEGSMRYTLRYTHGTHPEVYPAV